MQFKIDGGDGDQSYFDRSFLVRSCEEPWFPGVLPRGPAMLTKILNGVHVGEYLALTSRVTDSLEDQIAAGPWLSVVVHKLLKTGDEFRSDLETTQAIGMAVIEKVS